VIRFIGMQDEDTIRVELQNSLTWTRAGETEDEGRSYEQGVEAALAWVLDHSRPCPISVRCAASEVKR
jgi:hypothetical protein